MPNPVVHFEIMARENVGALREFYSNVFDWNVDADNPMNYGMVDTGDGGIRGGIATPMAGPSYATFYIRVDDLKASLRQIEAGGGKTIMPPTDLPEGNISIAMFKDPVGNLIGLTKYS